MRFLKHLTMIMALLIAFVAVGDAYAQQRKSKAKAKARTHHVVKKKTARRVVKKSRRRVKRVRAPKPTIHEIPGITCEDTCKHVHGIDLSHYQGEVFWDAIGEHTRMSYVYLKATEGGDRIDDRYERNIQMAHRHGLKVGSYHFFRPKVELGLQLQNFKAQCLPGEQDLVPMLDVESTGGLSEQAFCDSLISFLSLMEQTYHQKPLVYTGRNFYNKYLQGKLDDYQLMIAMYTDEEPILADGRDICLWQYSARGRIAGVSGHVDKSRFMGTHTLSDIQYQH